MLNLVKKHLNIHRQQS